MIYHPRMARAHTIKKDQGWLFFLRNTELMPNPHWPPTTLITKLRQRCNTLRRSMATCLAISWWALQQAPRMHYFTVWGEGWCFREADVGCHLCSIFLFFFFCFPALSVFPTSFLSLSIHLTFPQACLSSRFCHSICISLSVSVYLFLSVLSCFSHPLPLSSPLLLPLL